MQPEKPPFNAWAVAAVGVGCTVAGFALILYFAREPKGELPFLPGAWKGGPLLLCGGFLAICGALLMALRRFSLAAFIVAALVSGAFAAGAQAYVNGMREVTQRRFDVYLSQELQGAFIEQVKQKITPARLFDFALRYCAIRHSALPFDSLDIKYGGDPANPNIVRVTLETHSCPYLHTASSATIDGVSTYAKFLCEWNSSAVRGYKIEPYLVSYFTSDERPDTISLRNDEEIALLFDETQRPPLQNWSDPLCRLIDEFIRTDFRQRTRANAILEAITWLRDQETDPEVAAFLTDVLKEAKQRGPTGGK